MRRLIVLLLFAALPALADDLPKYWSVHIDRLADRPLYEAIDGEQSKIRGDIQRAHGITPTPLWKFYAANGAYYSLRPRQSLTDFDKPSPIPEEVRKEMQEKAGPLDDRIHRTLREHHNEIWQTDADLTHIVASGVPRYARLRTDHVEPAKDAEYEAAMKKICDDSRKRGISVVALWSAYGDGAYRYIFFADQSFDVPFAGRTLAKTSETVVMPRAETWLTPADAK